MSNNERGMNAVAKESVTTPSKTPGEDSSISPHHDVRVTLLDAESEKNKAYVLSIGSVSDTLRNHSRFILIVSMIFFVLSIGAAFLFLFSGRVHSGVSTAVVSLGFPEAVWGNNPLGGPLNFSGTIRSPYVAGQALDALGLRVRRVSADDISANLIVSGVTPRNIMETLAIEAELGNIVPERLREFEQSIFHPSEFVLELRRMGSLNYLTNNEMVDLLNEIVTQYIAHFTSVYSEFNFLDVVVGQFDHSEYDYFEIVDILNGTISNMLSYVASLRSEAPDFRSPSTQMTFGDIHANLNLISTIDIQRIEALVRINSMSRDRLRMANLLEHRITVLRRDLAEATANVETALHLATEVYRPQQWVYHTDFNYFLYERYSDIYVELMQSILLYSKRQNRLAVDIEFMQARVDALRAFQNPVRPQDIQFVEEAIPQLFESLTNWENIINETANDFLHLELFANAVNLISPAEFTSTLMAYWQTLAFIVLIGYLSGLFLAVFIALCRDAISDKPVHVPAHRGG